MDTTQKVTGSQLHPATCAALGARFDQLRERRGVLNVKVEALLRSRYAAMRTPRPGAEIDGELAGLLTEEGEINREFNEVATAWLREFTKLAAEIHSIHPTIPI